MQNIEKLYASANRKATLFLAVFLLALFTFSPPITAQQKEPLATGVFPNPNLGCQRIFLFKLSTCLHYMTAVYIADASEGIHKKEPSVQVTVIGRSSTFSFYNETGSKALKVLRDVGYFSEGEYIIANDLYNTYSNLPAKDDNGNADKTSTQPYLDYVHGKDGDKVNAGNVNEQ